MSKKITKAIITISDVDGENGDTTVTCMFDPAPPEDQEGVAPYSVGCTLKMLEAFNLYCLSQHNGLPFTKIEFPQVKNEDGNGHVVWGQTEMHSRAMKTGIEGVVNHITNQIQQDGGKKDDEPTTVH